MKTVLQAVLLLASAQALGEAVVLYEDQAVTVEHTLADPNDLWIHPQELGRVNGFELKPEGACIDDICVPVRQDQDSDIFVTRQGERWFNVAELADRLNQPYAVDHEAGVWSFGTIPVQRASFVNEGKAPDFTLPDHDGKLHSLSDFKGRKIMLLSWASW
jgi:hypothetical protein